jgi:hypothetical protein
MSNRIPELEVIEFKGASAIAEYSRKLRALGRDLAAELGASSQEVKAVLSAQQGHPLLFGADVKLRARKVARRLERAAELGMGIAVEAVKFNTEFRIQFADVLNPRKKNHSKKFNFDDE